MGLVVKNLPTLLFIGAFVSAIFFQGFFTDFLNITLFLLTGWLYLVLWRLDRFDIPVNAATLAIVVYVLSLAFAAYIGRVSISGFVHFFWALLLPLTCFLYLATNEPPSKEHTWNRAYAGLVVVVVGVGLYASYEWLVLNVEPRGPFLNRHAIGALINLVGLPLCALFLTASVRSEKMKLTFIALALLILAFTLAELKGRGALLSGLGGLAILSVASIRAVPISRMFGLVSVIAAGFMLATTAGRVDLGERMSTLANPHEAGWDRFLIWENSWRMLIDAPWYGLGLGHYAIYWPQYRDPSDRTAGFLVHNDYLQLWIEAGYPGLISLLLVVISVVYLFWCCMKGSTGARRVEITGIFAGLAAIGAHAFVDFSLNVAAVQVAAGLMLGRLVYLGKDYIPTWKWAPGLPVFASATGVKAAVSVLLLLPVSQFAFLFASSVTYREGLNLAATGKLVESYDMFSRSANWYPGADNTWLSKADLARQIIAKPEVEGAVRADLFEDAVSYLNTAEAINPYRWQTFVTRGKLVEENPDLAGDRWYSQATQGYRRALKVDPRAYEARYRLAALLNKRGSTDVAGEILEKGIAHHYADHPSLIPYLKLTANNRKRLGDSAGEIELTERIQRIMDSYQDTLSMPRK